VVDDEQADAMPAAEPAPPVPNSPDAEPALTEHEVRIGAAYVYGKRAALAGRPFQNPYFAASDEGKAWKSGYMDVMVVKR
jgi:hypothetical protein